jgi:hypothetical protein
MRILGIIASSVIKKFTDTFTRTTSAGTLGTSDSGGTYVINSTWNANGSKATTATAASSSPIAATDMYTTKPTISLDVENKNGVGIAFWVSDTNNYWGLHPYQATNYSQVCNAFTQACLSGGPGSQCVASQGFFSPANGGTAFRCQKFQDVFICNQFFSNCTTYSSSSSAGSRFLRLFKREGGTTSTVTESSISSAAASLKVVIDSALAITGTAYSGAGQTGSTLATITNSPSGQTTATKHGFLLTSDTWDPGNTADNLTISA